MSSFIPREGNNIALSCPISSAAWLVKAQIAALKDQFGGERHPESPACWLELCEFAGLRAYAVVDIEDVMTFRTPSKGWIMVYDRTAPAMEQVGMIAFGFSTYLLATSDALCAVCESRPHWMSVKEWRKTISEAVVNIYFPS